MPKTDLKTERKDLYAPPQGRFTEVVVPAMTFLAIDGTVTRTPLRTTGTPWKRCSPFPTRPSSSANAKPTATTSWHRWKGCGQPKDPNRLRPGDKSQWSWTMMIRQLDWVSATMIDQARITAEKKRLPAGPLVRCEAFEEGLSVQTLHVGSYDDEGPLVAELSDSYLPTHDLTPNGKHHEIYLNDPRKTEPAKLRVVLRQPVTRGK